MLLYVFLVVFGVVMTLNVTHQKDQRDKLKKKKKASLVMSIDCMSDIQNEHNCPNRDETKPHEWKVPRWVRGQQERPGKQSVR